MAENVWDEIWNKPAFQYLSYSPDELVQNPDKLAVDRGWLKEVKAEGDRLLRRDIAVRETLVHLVDKEFRPMAVAEALTQLTLLYAPPMEEPQCN